MILHSQSILLFVAFLTGFANSVCAQAYHRPYIAVGGIVSRADPTNEVYACDAGSIQDNCDCGSCTCEAPGNFDCGPLIFHRCEKGHSAKCRFGFGCIDKEFVPPRSWRIRRICRPWVVDQICETDRLLLDHCYYQPAWKVAGDIHSDYRNFHSRKGLALLGLGIGMHAVLANTSLDQQFRDSLQKHVGGNHDTFRVGRHLGAVHVMVPAVVGLWSLGECMAQESDARRQRIGSALNSWGAQTGRALFAGAVATGLLQVIIGASRPSELRGSEWRPFQDANGVSGHAFVGAVPFMVAAKRVESPLLKTTLLASSLVAGYSRIHEDKHYLSQVLLGWWIAHLSVEATELTNQSPLQYRWVPITHDGYTGLGVEFRR